MADKQASLNKEKTTIKVIILMWEYQYPTLVLDRGIYLKQSSENFNSVLSWKLYVQ